MHLRRAYAIVFALLPAVGAPAMAQSERAIERTVDRITAGDRLRVDPSLSVVESSDIEVGGALSMYALYLIDADDNSVSLLQPEASVYGRAVLGGGHTFFARARFQYRDFSEGDSFDGRGDRWTEPFLERYWYEFDYAAARAASTGEQSIDNFKVRLGRQFVDWNSGLTLSDTLLAVRPTLTLGPIEIEGIAGVTPGDESITDFDASRADYDKDTSRGFFGATLTATTPASQTFYAGVLHMTDYNDDDRAQFDLGAPVDFDYTATYLTLGSTGPVGSSVRYEAEFVLQDGTSMSDPLRGPQVEESIDAFAGRLKLTWLLEDPSRSRLEFEALMGSGDDDRLVSTDTVGGNLAGTNDTGFNSLGFVNTGLAFAPALSNLITLRAGASTFPLTDVNGLSRLQLVGDILVHHKFDADAPIEEPTTDDSFLGVEADIAVNYRITSDLSLAVRYGIFFPGEALVADHTRHFVFVGVTLSF